MSDQPGDELVAKISDISKRLDAAQQQPGYNMDVFNRFAAEAKETLGEKHAMWLEFLGPYMPSEGAPHMTAVPGANTLARRRRAG